MLSALSPERRAIFKCSVLPGSLVEKKNELQLQQEKYGAQVLSDVQTATDQQEMIEEAGGESQTSMGTPNSFPTKPHFTSVGQPRPKLRAWIG